MPSLSHNLALILIFFPDMGYLIKGHLSIKFQVNPARNSRETMSIIESRQTDRQTGAHSVLQRYGDASKKFFFYLFIFYKAISFNVDGEKLITINEKENRLYFNYCSAHVKPVNSSKFAARKKFPRCFF